MFGEKKTIRLDETTIQDTKWQSIAASVKCRNAGSKKGGRTTKSRRTMDEGSMDSIFFTSLWRESCS